VRRRKKKVSKTREVLARFTVDATGGINEDFAAFWTEKPGKPNEQGSRECHWSFAKNDKKNVT
jgi:hypothetical protein